MIKYACDIGIICGNTLGVNDSLNDLKPPPSGKKLVWWWVGLFNSMLKFEYVSIPLCPV